MTFNFKTNSIIMAFKLVCISRKLLKKKKNLTKTKFQKKSAKSQHHNKFSEYLQSISQENYHIPNSIDLKFSNPNY